MIWWMKWKIFKKTPLEQLQYIIAIHRNGGKIFRPNAYVHKLSIKFWSCKCSCKNTDTLSKRFVVQHQKLVINIFEQDGHHICHENVKLPNINLSILGNVWLSITILTMYSMPITTDIVSSNLDQGEVYKGCDKVCQWLAAGRWFSPLGCVQAVTHRFVSYDLFSFVIVYVMTLHPWKRRWIPQGEMCFCRSNALNYSLFVLWQ